MMRSSAASDLPMPLLPSSSTPTPSTSMQHGVDAGRGRQLQLEVLLDRDRWPPTRPAACAAAARPRSVGALAAAARHLQPLGHDHAGRVEAEERLRPTAARPPPTASRGTRSPSRPAPAPAPGGPAARNPASASPGFWIRWIGDPPPQPRLPRQQRQPQLRPLVEQRPDRQRRRHLPHHTDRAHPARRPLPEIRALGGGLRPPRGTARRALAGSLGGARGRASRALSTWRLRRR